MRTGVKPDPVRFDHARAGGLVAELTANELSGDADCTAMFLSLPRTLQWHSLTL